MEKKTFKSILLIVTYTLLLAYVLFNFENMASLFGMLISVVLPFIIGGALAFVLNVPMKAIERILFKKAKSKVANKLKRPVSLLLTIIIVFGVIGVILFVVIPELGKTFVSLAESCAKFPGKILDFLDKYNIDVPMIKEYIQKENIDWESIINSIVGFARNGIGNVFSSTFGIISGVISGVTCGVISFVFSIYVLCQKEKLGSQAKRIVYAFMPESKADYVMKVSRLANVTFSNFITGQCAEAIILGMMFYITLTLLKFHYALLIGMLIALTALVPIFGAFVGCIVGTFLLLMVDPMQALWFLLIFQILQQIEGNLIYPYVVGGSVGLPSIWVLVAVTIGGNLFGVTGMLCFIPLCSVCYALFREKVISIEKKKAQLKKQLCTNECDISTVCEEVAVDEADVIKKVEKQNKGKKKKKK